MTAYSTLTDAELSERVAERVMGWTKRVTDCGSLYGWTDQLGRWCTTFDPASSWSDAGRVLERMRELGWDCAIEMPAGTLRPRATFDRADRPGCGARAYADTAPRAICEAALKAMDAQGQQEG